MHDSLRKGADLAALQPEVAATKLTDQLVFPPSNRTPSAQESTKLVRSISLRANDASTTAQPSQRNSLASSRTVVSIPLRFFWNQECV
jgi:hypothetical protein